MLEPGSRVAGYLIESVLGHGGMGVVYEASQLTLDRKVALKVLSRHLGMDSSFRDRFRHEGRIQAALDHPHIVTVYEAGEIEQGLFIAMRLIRGPTLKETIMRRELEGARTLRILRPIADALDSAHEAGLIHRDVKPQNVLIGAHDHAYLADFGLTKGINDLGFTRTGQFVGTIDYIAPELIRGEPASTCGDVYSFGAVLYECLTGVVPYPRPSDAAVMYAHLTEAPPMVTDHRPELPTALDDVVGRAMAKDPKDRPDSATEVIEQAEHAFGRHARAILTPPRPVEHPHDAGIRDSEREVSTRPSSVRGRVRANEASAAPPLAAPPPSVETAPARAQTTNPGVRAPDVPAQPPPPATGSDEEARGAPGPAPRRRRARILPLVALLAVLAIAVPVALATLGGNGSDDEASGGGEIQLIRLAAGGGPAALTAGGGSVWTVSQDGDAIARLDPKSGRITGQVADTPDFLSQVAVADSGTLWAISTTGELAAVGGSPPRATLVATLAVAPYDLASGFGALWVANGTAGVVTRVSLEDRRVSAERDAEVGQGVAALAIGPKAVWAANPDTGFLVRIDPSNLAVTGRLDIGSGVNDIAAGDYGCWVARPGAGEVVRVAPEGDRVLTRVRVPATERGAVATGDGITVYADLTRGDILRLDPEDGGAIPVARDVAPGAAGVVVADGAAWVSDPNRDTIHRIPLGSPSEAP
jgi:serine/threonine protein kinase/streptogramin lyase